MVRAYLLEHLQYERSVFSQPLTLLSCLQAELVGLVLQSRHLLLHKTTQKSVLLVVLTYGAPARRWHDACYHSSANRHFLCASLSGNKWCKDGFPPLCQSYIFKKWFTQSDCDQSHSIRCDTFTEDSPIIVLHERTPAGDCVSSPSSWPHCAGTRLSPAAAAGWWFLALPPGCSLSPAAETPGPQTF